MANKSLTKAKKEKNDEFYTQLPDIERELKHYREHFRGATVFCNCDDPEYSNFAKYFQLNFHFLGLKKLICTHYEKDKPSYKLEIVARPDDDGQITLPEYIRTPLLQNGDFRSPECVELLKEADIVVTNPPFSLLREYVAQLMEYQKKFVIIGSQNAITDKEIFSLFRKNKIWLGNYSGDMSFRVPDWYEARETRFWIDEQGKKWRSLGNCCWFTNLDIRKRHYDLVSELVEKYSPDKYPKYDNYDAINVDKVMDIPVDYYGLMGVPITFFDKYNPEQFEILGVTRGAAGDYSEWADEEAYPTKKYINCVQIRKDGTQSKNGMANTRATILVDEPPVGKDYYIADNADKPMIICYARILIRRKGATNENNEG